MEINFKHDIDPSEIPYYSFLFIRYYIEEFMEFENLQDINKDFAKLEYYYLAESSKRAIESIKIIWKI